MFRRACSLNLRTPLSLIEITSSDYGCDGVRDAINYCNLMVGDLFAALMAQHRRLKCTQYTWARGNTGQRRAASHNPPDADLLFGYRPSGSEPT